MIVPLAIASVIAAVPPPLTAPQQLLRATNMQRASMNLPPFVLNENLSAAAQWKAEDLASSREFSHKDSQGRMPWKLATDFGYGKYRVIRENIATTFVDARAVVQAWDQSPSHRENQFCTDGREVGVGFAQVPGKRRQNYWVLIIGSR